MDEAASAVTVPGGSLGDGRSICDIFATTPGAMHRTVGTKVVLRYFVHRSNLLLLALSWGGSSINSGPLLGGLLLLRNRPSCPKQQRRSAWITALPCCSPPPTTSRGVPPPPRSPPYSHVTK